MLSQELTTKQKLRLSPAQLQTIGLLGLPITELETRITEELENNPALEENSNQTDENEDILDFYQEDKDTTDNQDDSNIDFEQYISDDDIPDYRTYSNNNSPDAQQMDMPLSGAMSLQEYLLSQLGMQTLSETEQQIAEYIIGSIDEDGYLRTDIMTLADGIAFKNSSNVTDEDVQRVWNIIRTFDPDGIAAQDLQDCLLLQLRHKAKSPTIQIAEQIISKCWEDFSMRRFDKIKTHLRLSEQALKDATEEIAKLTPKPGNRWADSEYDRNKNIITPDFIVENINGKLIVSLNNGNIPQLCISQEFKETMSAYKQSAIPTKELQKAAEFVKQKLDAAQSFISAIQQRNETLQRTMVAIVQHQKSFFLEGDDITLKPMILKDIADATGYDISTISRVSNQKYVQTEFGIFSLKHFFSDSITKDTGEEVSIRELKQKLVQLINDEDKRKPLTDEQLTALLQQQGFPVARRTVAKYREANGIPVARLRKNF